MTCQKNPPLSSNEHTVADMVRIFGIRANDHDTLRTEPACKRIANRPPNDAYLAS